MQVVEGSSTTLYWLNNFHSNCFQFLDTFKEGQTQNKRSYKNVRRCVKYLATSQLKEPLTVLNVENPKRSLREDMLCLNIWRNVIRIRLSILFHLLWNRMSEVTALQIWNGSCLSHDCHPGSVSRLVSSGVRYLCQGCYRRRRCIN